MKRFFLLAICSLALVGIAGCDVSREYVESDRQTLQAVGPEYLDYVQRDASLDEAAKASRIDTVDGWRLRVDAAQGVDSDPIRPASASGAPPLISPPVDPSTQ